MGLPDRPANWPPISMPPEARPPPQTWPTVLAITRQAIAKHLALLTDTGLVTAEPGERRRVRYRLRSAPMQVAQQFLAALARDWDGALGALRDHLDSGTG